jgi:O-acetyl-ADP-ribose deacetylase (regulator of RNase III)
MIETTTGDILTADAEALVNTVNCVGIMGRGIALQFRKAFPDNFKAYEAVCKRHELQPGHMFVFQTGQLTNPRYIINFPTKRHWKGKSQLADIESGLQSLVAEVLQLGIRSLAIPPLGCGQGGLDWAEVRPRIEQALAAVPDVRVLLFNPTGAPASTVSSPSHHVPQMTAARAALVGLMQRYLAGLMDPFVSLLEVHKLLYFMQEAGESLQLRYVKAPYGPYAENLRHLLLSVDGHMVSGYTDGIDDPEKQLELVPGAVTDADRFLAGHPDTHGRFDRVADLVRGFETPFGLELLSTVHWVTTREDATTPDRAVQATLQWNERKRRFSPQQIALAWNVLRDKGWLTSPRAVSQA